MSRSMWFLAGAGSAVYAIVRGRRAAEALTADGLADRARSLALGARMFRDEVARGSAEKETELRDRLGLRPDGGTRELTAPTSMHLRPGIRPGSRPETHRPARPEEDPT